MGTGRAELRATVILEVLAVAAEIWVGAAAPVRTRATTAVRMMMLFMTGTIPGIYRFKLLIFIYLANVMLSAFRSRLDRRERTWEPGEPSCEPR